ncbi:cytochrome P450 [Rhizoctonia solani]|uniref:Cytochrome P450 n=1 Tax=Rhizoctonia solani TaxID=456999 RepID=A0A8H7LPH0_9AGAM|nr:cytochrome P450 [Rhizoctonia solani]
MPRSPINWGAGLSIVLGSLPSLVLPPALAVSVPLLLEQALPRDSASEFLRLFLDLPTAVRSIIALGVLAIIRTSIGRYQRQLDRKKFGPDVVEIPKIKLKWPLNLDFIPFDTNVMQNEYCGTTWEIMIPQHGNTFNLGLFGQDQIMTVEPEVVKAILSTDFNSYEKGETWKFHRSMSRPYFTRDRISHFDNFARHADIAISKLLSRVSEPSRPAVDFQDLVARFTLDSGTEFLFGRDTRSLDAPLPYPHGKPADDSASFAAAFSRAQGQVMQRFGLAMFWPWMELFWDRTAEDMKIINAYVTPILRKKLERGSGIESKPTNEGDQDADTLLDHLVKFTQGEYMDRCGLDEIINILVAARDTTATTLTFAVYILAENPAIMSRLRDEITGRLGTSNHPTPDDLKEMKYLRAVINETLRLFPAVPVNVRAAAKSTVLPINGKRYYIPAGTRMTWSTLMMHRRKDLWGPDADNFDPDRWLDDRLKKYVTPNPFIFLPFNAGPRICLGQQFAYNEASFFLCRLLQRVESIKLVPEAHPVGTLPRPGWKNGTGRRVYEKVWPKNHLTLYCNGGLWVRMKEARVV